MDEWIPWMEIRDDEEGRTPCAPTEDDTQGDEEGRTLFGLTHCLACGQGFFFDEQACPKCGGFMIE